MRRADEARVVAPQRASGYRWQIMLAGALGGFVAAVLLTGELDLGYVGVLVGVAVAPFVVYARH
jgi:hypothetical protein